jgi:hypothetical protein
MAYTHTSFTASKGVLDSFQVRRVAQYRPRSALCFRSQSTVFSGPSRLLRGPDWSVHGAVVNCWRKDTRPGCTET